MITQKLYLQDMYAREAEATILMIDENRVLLDRTVFYAESGGQLGDTGWINQTRVGDTQKTFGKETVLLNHPEFPSIQVRTNVVHILEQAADPFQVGQTVHLRIDWQRRYAIMRLHSTAHVVWYFVEQLLGKLPIKGCLIGPDKARLDFGAKIEPECLPELTRVSNEFIAARHAIENEPLPAEPEALFWLCDRIRIPCGGTHVRNTGEIGPISLKRRSQGKQLDRLYISCEQPAIDRLP